MFTQVCADYKKTTLADRTIAPASAIVCSATTSRSDRTKRNSKGCYRISPTTTEGLINAKSPNMGKVLLFPEKQEGYMWHPNRHGYRKMSTHKFRQWLARAQLQPLSHTENVHSSQMVQGNSQLAMVPHKAYSNHFISESDFVSGFELLKNTAVSYNREGEMRTLHNIGFLFSGYNLLNGNPFPREGIDPGFSMSPLFTTVYKGGRTDDGRVLLPVGVHAYKTISCQSHAQTFVFKTASDYSKYVSSQIGVQASFGKISASLNREHSERLKLLLSSDNMMLRAMNSCYMYTAKLDMYNPPEVDKSFRYAIHSTQANSTKDVKKLIQEYGTHFLNMVQMGYRKGIDVVMKKSVYSRSEGVQEKIQAIVAFGPVGLSKGKSEGESSVDGILNQAVRKYEFSIGKEQVWEGDHSNLQNYFAPLKYSVLPMPSLPGLSKKEKVKLNKIYLINMNNKLETSSDGE